MMSGIASSATTFSARLVIRKPPGPLGAQLAYSNAHVRCATVVALARIASSDSYRTLEQSTQREDWEVRLYASEALKSLEKGK